MKLRREKVTSRGDKATAKMRENLESATTALEEAKNALKAARRGG